MRPRLLSSWIESGPMHAPDRSVRRDTRDDRWPADGRTAERHHGGGSKLVGSGLDHWFDRDRAVSLRVHGLLSFLLLPGAAISWSRTIILSVPAREGGKRAFIVGGLALGTVIGAAILFAFARALFGHPTND